jgi:hypothetical protein
VELRCDWDERNILLEIRDRGPGIAVEPLSLDRLEWEHIQRVLAEHGGNVSATARVEAAPAQPAAQAGEAAGQKLIAARPGAGEDGPCGS